MVTKADTYHEVETAMSKAVAPPFCTLVVHAPGPDYHTIMESHLSATEAARTFSDILNRVRYRGEAFIVERGGEPVCRISPVAGTRGFTATDLLRLLDIAPTPDPAYLDTVEALAKNQPQLPCPPWEP